MLGFVLTAASVVIINLKVVPGSNMVECIQSDAVPLVDRSSLLFLFLFLFYAIVVFQGSI